MTDGNMETYWAVEDDNLTPTAFITLPKPATFDVIRLREQIRLGQRVDSFNIDAFINGKWVCIDNEGKTIGNQVMRRLNRPITAQKLRLRITGSQATPCISEILPLPPACRRRAALHLPPRRQPHYPCGRQEQNPIHDGQATNPRKAPPSIARVPNLRKAARSRPLPILQRQAGSRQPGQIRHQQNRVEGEKRHFRKRCGGH